MSSYKVTVTFLSGNTFISTHRANSPEAAMHKAFDTFGPGALVNLRSFEIEEA